MDPELLLILQKKQHIFSEFRFWRFCEFFLHHSGILLPAAYIQTIMSLYLLTELRTTIINSVLWIGLRDTFRL